MTAERLATAEIRWFLPGSPPGGFVPTGASGEGERVDRYLVLPGISAVGVKIREDRFEIKAQRGEAGTVRLARGATGRAARWLKWSAGGPGMEAWLRAQDDGGGGEWIDVAKRRRLVFASPEGRWRSAFDEAYPVQVEWTTLRAGDRRYWTFGFELSVLPGRASKALVHAAAACLERLRPDGVPALEVHDSLSYPEWLDRITPGS